MGYNQENFRRIRAEYETKAMKAEEAADERREELYRRIPDLRDLDRALSGFGLRLMKQAMEGGDTQAGVASLQAENERIQAARRDLLALYGYPADYCTPRYECEKCRDSGYIGIRMCSCMRKKLTEAGMISSGLGMLMKSQSFENFSLDYYKNDPATYARMRDNLQKIRTYANNFGGPEWGKIAQRPSSSAATMCFTTARSECSPTLKCNGSETAPRRGTPTTPPAIPPATC